MISLIFNVAFLWQFFLSCLGSSTFLSIYGFIFVHFVSKVQLWWIFLYIIWDIIWNRFLCVQFFSNLHIWLCFFVVSFCEHLLRFFYWINRKLFAWHVEHLYRKQGLVVTTWLGSYRHDRTITGSVWVFKVSTYSNEWMIISICTVNNP